MKEKNRVFVKFARSIERSRFLAKIRGRIDHLILSEEMKRGWVSVNWSTFVRMSNSIAGARRINTNVKAEMLILN
jgi:hypothetical protein